MPVRSASCGVNWDIRLFGDEALRACFVPLGQKSIAMLRLAAGPCGPAFDPVDQVTTLWTNKTGLQGGSVGKRNCALWMSEGLVLLQLDPLDHHFDPEDQVPTLWISAN